jgi:protein-tyrosine kinase
VRKGKSVVITKETLEAGGFVAPDGAQTRISQQFRTIKRTLINNALQRSGETLKYPRRIMVTSAYPGEGKTFCSINLALSLAAERDLRVLLIDADVARPRVMKALGLKSGPGLMDWLEGDSETPDGLIMPTNIGGLALMSSGRSHTHATELLSSNETTRRLKLLDSVLRQYIIVFDSSPLLITTESLALSRLMGQVVLVVEADKTPRRSVEESCNMLSDHPSVSLLLNKQKIEESTEYYEYGKYGYGST